MANTTGVADHKATGPAIPGLTVERTKAIILLIVQLFSVAQTGLSIAGISQLPFTTDQVSTAITGATATDATTGTAQAAYAVSDSKGADATADVAPIEEVSYGDGE